MSTLPSAPAARTEPGADRGTLPMPIAANSRTASDVEWGDAARRIAEGETMTAVAARLGCSRSTLWRTLQRSERLRTRIEEERRYLAVEAATRFKGLHGAALEAIEAAIRKGDLRAAFWVADRLGLAKRELAEAREGLAMVEDAIAWGEAPPEEMGLFALDTPLTLEPDVKDELAGRTPPAPELAPEPAAAKPAAPPADAAPRRATLPKNRSTLLHRTAALPPFTPDPDLPPLEELLRALPATDAAWPDIQRQMATVHTAVFGGDRRRKGQRITERRAG